MSDGTNSFAWDAADRMIKITYPGSSNFSDFVYDPLGRNVKIVETTAGSVTSTQQFIWCSDKMRKNRACEERDASGVVTIQFFEWGQLNGATKHFYAKDQLSSVTEMTNNSGATVSARSYDPFGRPVVKSESVMPSYGFANLYLHSRSGLNLSRTRVYSSTISRWLSRDSIGEIAGSNLYTYSDNEPIAHNDPSGKSAVACCLIGAEMGAPLGPPGIVAGAALGALAGIGIAYAAGQIVGIQINKADSGSTSKSRGRPLSKRCEKQKQKCIEDNSETPPLGGDPCNQGTPFFNAVNECMEANKCPRIY